MGLFSSKSKTKSQVDPWDQVTPFLLGQDGNTNLYGEAQDLFRTNQGDLTNFKDQYGGASQAYLDLIRQRGADPMFNITPQIGGQILQGAQNTNRGDVSNIQGVNPLDPTNYAVNMNDARASQGILNPTQALGQLLSGRPDTQYLDQQSNAIQANAARNLMENVMPGIRSESVLSGQYGGTRQGLAEGLAMSRLNQDLAPAITGMYSNAFENAQGRMAGTADALNNQAFNTALSNVDNRLRTDSLNQQNALNTQQFNANLGLQNNQFAMNQGAQNVANQQAGLNMQGQGLDQQNAQFNDYLNTLQNSYQNPQALQQNNLNAYSNLLNQGAALGSQSVSKTKNSGSLMSNILGTAAGIGGLAMMATGPAGMMAGSQLLGAGANNT